MLNQICVVENQPVPQDSSPADDRETKPVYWLSRCQFIVDSHLVILSEKEFFGQIQNEIRYYQHIVRDFSDKSAQEWIDQYAKAHRLMWSPFLFPNEYAELVRSCIQEHRWNESWNHSRDMGIQSEIDWINRFASPFRKKNRFNG